MNRQEYIRESTNYLGRLAYEIKSANASGHFDINKVTEDFLIPILSRLYKCPDLRNQNQLQMNFPAVDLGCDSTKISFQVTSDASSSKIVETLKTFREHKLEKDFRELYVYVIREKQKAYKSASLTDEIKKLPIEFDINECIIDYTDVVAKLNEADIETLALVHNALENEFKKKDEHLKFRESLDHFLEFARSKIAVEIATKKYIPAVFIETSKTKDAVRYFANPLFFYRKIDDLIARINLSDISELIFKVGGNPEGVIIDDAKRSDNPDSLGELSIRLQEQKEALCKCIEALRPFSMDRDKSKCFTPNAENEAMWDVFRLQIEYGGYGIIRQIEKTISAIDLTRHKIFLVTGMAGQGKTNFVCDLVENQFQTFEIPSIFIPARDLNHFSAPDRIFKFITNNRYAPKTETLHELLELIEAIAKESQKPFIIAIDGINEVSALVEFNAELKTFLNAVCQYDYIKVLITCRSEFFDQRFETILDEPCAQHLYRVQDLKSEMSNGNRARLLSAYFKYFNISLELSQDAEAFLESDLLLLRIFCEIHEGEGGRYIAGIYKGNIFEEYLRKKAKEFPANHQRNVIPTLHKIAQAMLGGEAFTSLSTRNFNTSEMEIIDRFIAEDIVLRREVPDPGLQAIGNENVSFTYDELRDFIIADYLITGAREGRIDAVRVTFEQLPKLPIYEGVFRYVYILARKSSNSDIVMLCESAQSFQDHYVRNLELLPPEVQSDDDVAKLKDIMSSSENSGILRSIAVFLYRRRSNAEKLNIQILIDHINSLPEEQCREFLAAIISNPNDYRAEAWRQQADKILNNALSRSEGNLELIEGKVLSFLLQIAGYANWTTREQFLNDFTKILDTETGSSVIASVNQAQSETIRQSVLEVRSSMGVGQ